MPREQILSVIRERLLRARTYRVGRDTAEDIAQETLLLLETKYPHVANETEMVKLSFTISSYVEQSLRRKLKRDRELPQVDGWNPPDPAASQEYNAFLASVRAKIGELTGKCPQLLLLHLEGHTAEEICGILGASKVGTVYVWTHRCIESLKVKLGLAGGA